MFKLFLIISIFGFSLSAFGEGKIVVDSPANWETDTLKLPRTNLYANNRAIAEIDSIKPLSQANRLHQPKDSLGVAVNNGMDSVNTKLSTLQQRAQQNVDTLFSKPKAWIGKLSSRKESLTLPDSVTASKNNLERKITAPTERAESFADSVQQSIINKAEEKRTLLESKLTDLGGDKAKLPDGPMQGLQQPSLNLPGASPNTPVAELSTQTLPSTAIDHSGAAPQINTAIPGTDINTSIKTPDVKSVLPEVDLPAVAKVKDVASETAKMGEKLEEVKQYDDQAAKLKDNVSQEKIEQEVENKVAASSQGIATNGEFAKADKFKQEQSDLIKRYQSQSQLREEAKRKAMNVANDKLSVHAAKIKEGQADLSKLKKRDSGIHSIGDIFKKRSTELEGRKPYERLVPGITLQTLHSKPFQTELGAQLGYRFTPRFTAGAGASWQLGFDQSYNDFVNALGTHGGRMFMKLEAIKGFYAQGEVVAMKLGATSNKPPTVFEKTDMHYYGTNLGIGKKFNVTRHISGFMLGLYRIEHSGTLPSASKISVRIGFDYMIRKDKKLQ